MDNFQFPVFLAQDEHLDSIFCSYHVEKGFCSNKGSKFFSVQNKILMVQLIDLSQVKAYDQGHK